MGDARFASCPRPPRKTAAAFVAACAAITVLAACGTTVPQTTTLNGAAGGASTLGSQAGAANAGSDGLSPSGGGSDLGQPTTGGASGAGATSTGSASATSGGAGSSAANPVAGGTAVAGGTQPGVTTPGKNPASTKTGTTTTKTGGKDAAGGGKSAAPTAVTKSAGTTTASAANGPGITATTIKIGVVNITNGAAAQAALGSSVSEGSLYSYAVAVSDYVNKHGGIGGRQISLQKYDVDATSTMTADQQDAAICGNFTQDDPVFAYLDAADANTRACFSKAHVAMIGNSEDSVGLQELQAYPTYIDVGENTPEDEMTNLVASLAKTDYLTSKWNTTSGSAGGVLPVKLGILLPNLPRWGNAVNNYLLPALKAKGISVASSDVITYPFPQSTSDDATAVASIDNAELTFASDNVTHVISVEFNGLGFFAQAAGNQKYYPRYAIETSNEPQYGYTSGVIPSGALNGAVGFGELPLVDLTDASAYASPAQKTCTDLMTAAGINNASGISLTAEVSVCDQFFLLQKAVAAIPAGQGITDTAVVSAIEGLGSTFPIAALPAARFGAGKHYAAVQGYPEAWDTGCTCVKYTGAAFTLS